MALVRGKRATPRRCRPLGHEAVDGHGAAVLREWIASLPDPPVVSPPALAPAGGDFPKPVRVIISDAGAAVRYTLDGSPPGPPSPAASGPLTPTGPTTVRARAFKPGHTRSVVVQETFVIGP